ncbi:MAG: TolC family protein [Spirochaetes bacterium]|nr:TolC family protein [Spirochaetota bacterium]
MMLLTALLFSQGGPLPRALSLKEAIALAVQNDVERELRSRGLHLTESSLFALRRKYFPALSVSYQSYVSRVLREDDSRDRSVRADLTQLIWDGGQTGLAGKVTSLTYLADKEALTLYESDLANKIRLLYFDALRQRQALDLARKYLDASTRQSEISRKEMELGLLVETDFLYILSKTREAERDLLTAERQFKESLYALRLACGVEAEAAFTVQGDLETGLALFPLEVDLPRLKALGEAGNPAFRKSHLETLRTGHELILARLGSFPVLSLGGYWQLGGIAQKNLSQDFGATLSFSTPFFGSSVQGSYGLASRRNTAALDENESVKLGLFDDPRYFAAIEEKKIAAETARRQEQLTRKQFAVQLESLSESLRMAWRELKTTDDLVALLTRRLAILETRVGLGEAKRLDYVKDMNDAQMKRLERLASRLAYAKQAADLETLLGLPQGGLALVRGGSGEGP